MLPDARSLQLALTLYGSPTYVPVMRKQRLPDGCDTILSLAADDATFLSSAATLSGRNSDDIRKAARFFVEQILLYPEADKYRVLGANIDASHQVLQRNMRLLLTWLHPDASGSENAALATRVLSAWNALKTPELRARYDIEMKRPTVSSRRSKVFQWDTRNSVRRLSVESTEKTASAKGLSRLFKRLWSWADRNGARD